MKKVLNISFSICTALLFVVSSTAVAQQSDYQIQQDFRADYNELTERINNAVSSDDLSGIVGDIETLEADYSEHSELLDHALYPDTFSERMTDLRARFGITEENIDVIEELNERLTELEDELEDYRSRFEQLDSEHADLQEQFDEASANERNLSALVRQYRQNLERRDAFTSEFLESLLTKYSDMDSDTRSEIADASERLQDDPIELIKTIISEYTNLADQSSGLDTPDYVQMRAQHGYFNEVWERVGERLAETFAPDNSVEAEQEITDLLAAWQASVDNKLWNQMATSFNQNGIELPPFTNSSTFVQSLNSYVDEAVEASLEGNSEENLETYQTFSDFWNTTVKGAWAELLVEGNILTQSDISAIDIKLNEWSQEAAPTSNLMFILFLISLAVIIGLVVLLVTKKS